MSALSSWSPGDYKRAGEKHFKTCQHLLSSGIVQQQMLGAILFDIYYLSGYVIECLLKYYILIRKHFKLNEKLSLKQLEVLCLKDHNIQKLSIIANEEGGKNIEFCKKSSLFKNWSEQIRYGLSDSLTEGAIKLFFNEIASVRAQLLTF